MIPWDSDDPPAIRQIQIIDYGRIAVRWVGFALVVYVSLIAFWIVRLVELPLGKKFSPFITRFACINCLRVLQICYRQVGSPMSYRGAVVSNHVSWLDIFSLNARQSITFVAKEEVRNWFGIGILARATGALFISRDPREAARQKIRFSRRLAAGDKLLFFPEATSTDGKRVLPFKSTLFAAFFEENLKKCLHVQPVTLNYVSPPGEEPRFYGFWGPTEFGGHLLRVLAARPGGEIEVIFHEPARVRDFASRKSLSAHCENVIRDSLQERLGNSTE